MTALDLADLAAERAVVGSLIIGASAFDSAPAMLRKVRDSGLEVDHFTAPAHAALFVAVSNAIAAGALIGIGEDTVLLAAALADDPRVAEPLRLIDEVCGEQFDAANVEAHAERVVSLARRRVDVEAAGLLRTSALSRDRGAAHEQRSHAVALLSRPVGRARMVVSPRQAAADFIDRSSQPAPERFPFPWHTLNRRTRGGLARKQNIVIGGWSGIGKSASYDEILWLISIRRRVHVASYLTEMGAEERMDRNIARIARVPYGKIDDGTYRDDESDSWKAMDAAQEWATHGITQIEAAGMTAEEIAADVLLNRWDVFGVDVLHEVAHSEKTAERGLSKIVQTLRHAAVQANAALVMCAHLNDARNTGGQRPEPVGRDIRDSGMIHRGADIVLLVHRQDDEHGIATNRGFFKIDKTRKGQPSRFEVVYDGDYLQWTTAAAIDIPGPRYAAVA